MEPWILVVVGAALLAVATLLCVRLSIPLVTRPIAAIVAASVIVAVSSSVAYATHTIVTGSNFGWLPSPWNGWRVYLSSPTHSDSGSRGECGWEENINGRHWNYYAASVNTGGLGSLYDRHYYVIVSGNPRDDSYASNVTYANNWGANVYIITHSNAQTGGCPGSASYLLVMYPSASSPSVSFKDSLLYQLDPATPGGQNNWNCDGFYECNSVNATRRAYVELFFHTNQSAVNWFQGSGAEGAGGVTESYRYGAAVDMELGYPR